MVRVTQNGQSRVGMQVHEARATTRPTASMTRRRCPASQCHRPDAPIPYLRKRLRRHRIRDCRCHQSPGRRLSAGQSWRNDSGASSREQGTVPGCAGTYPPLHCRRSNLNYHHGGSYERIRRPLRKRQETRRMFGGGALTGGSAPVRGTSPPTSSAYLAKPCSEPSGNARR